jgi:hypothetical protein
MEASPWGKKDAFPRNLWALTAKRDLKRDFFPPVAGLISIADQSPKV